MNYSLIGFVMFLVFFGILAWFHEYLALLFFFIGTGTGAYLVFKK